MRLLYAEDEPALSEAVVDYLTYHKYIVDAVYDGEDAYVYAASGKYDGIILDIMMPKRDGLDVLSDLRRNGCRTPVLLLTAKTQVEDRIRGLDSGADDYLPKPFDMGELLARIRAMLRRREEYHPDLIRFGDLVLNMQSGEISVGDTSFLLPKQEYRLMEQLMLNHMMYLSTEDLLTKAWGYNMFMQFRHEVKHEISHHDMLILRQRLKAVMRPDSHAVNGRYEIRSLYFDMLPCLSILVCGGRKCWG